MIIFRRLDDDCMKSCRIFAAELGKMPEWSIGPHSKCGERATVPRVRIPVFPQNGRCKSSVYKIYAFFCAQFLGLPVYRICFSEKEMQQFQKEPLPKGGCHEPSFRGRFEGALSTNLPISYRKPLYLEKIIGFLRKPLYLEKIIGFLLHIHFSSLPLQ